jgi:cytosine/adenosine deaminase-related metal-dependent hydrolase
MHYISAGRIHDGRQWLPEGSVIALDDQGTIQGIYPPGSHSDVAEHYSGLLCPGFVNAHCHLELSHMKGAIPEHTGLVPFLQQVTFHRNDFTEEQKETARHDAYDELLRNGVVAVGDIANGTDTLDLRKLDELHIYTFVESIGFSPAFAQQRFDYAFGVYQQFALHTTSSKMLRQSIVPHAPYSVSDKLFGLIDAHSTDFVVSVHNQETEGENEYYQSKQGSITQLLKGLGIDDSSFEASGQTSLQTYLPWMPGKRPLLLVHNTFTSAEDLAFAHAHKNQVFWCLCPNANLYIENRLPDIDMLINEGAAICLGTDSLASNHQLSIWSEIAAIRQYYPHISLETLLCWATSNGAKALQMNQQIGSIEVGKQPGIIHIDEAANTLKRLY